MGALIQLDDDNYFESGKYDPCFKLTTCCSAGEASFATQSTTPVTSSLFQEVVRCALAVARQTHHACILHKMYYIQYTVSDKLE